MRKVDGFVNVNVNVKEIWEVKSSVGPMILIGGWKGGTIRLG